MHWSVGTVKVWLLLLCVALLATRVADSHLHLCFDGQEPPIAVHSAVEQPHHAADEAVHSDQDVELSQTALAKWSASGMDVDTLLFVAMFYGLSLPSHQQARPVDSPVSAGLLIRLLRPPLRGPPRVLPA